jgi:hypothetical protein
VRHDLDFVSNKMSEGDGDLCISDLDFRLDFNKKIYFCILSELCVFLVLGRPSCAYLFLFSRRRGLILLVPCLSPVAVCSGESSP